MNAKQKRIEAVLAQLYTIHEQLFGQKYTIGMILDKDKQSEFNAIITEFRELVFTIRSSQEEREKKEASKTYKNTPDKIKINHEIRQDIQRAQGLLKEAVKRINTGGDTVTQQVIENREKELKNCYEILQDVKEVEQGGTYRPPEYPSLQQIKLNLLSNNNLPTGQTEQQINMEEEIAIDKFNERDRQMDGILDEIIDVNGRVRNKMKAANQAIDHTHGQIKHMNKKTDHLVQRVTKADMDLAEILKTYRRPSQLCLNVMLILMVLALIAVIVNLIKSPTI